MSKKLYKYALYQWYKSRESMEFVLSIAAEKVAIGAQEIVDHNMLKTYIYKCDRKRN